MILLTASIVYSISICIYIRVSFLNLSKSIKLLLSCHNNKLNGTTYTEHFRRYNVFDDVFTGNRNVYKIRIPTTFLLNFSKKYLIQQSNGNFY